MPVGGAPAGERHLTPSTRSTRGTRTAFAQAAARAADATFNGKQVGYDDCQNSTCYLRPRYSRVCTIVMSLVNNSVSLGEQTKKPRRTRLHTCVRKVVIARRTLRALHHSKKWPPGTFPGATFYRQLLVHLYVAVTTWMLS